MISQKKLEANRRNALKSTGPKTDEGKAVAAQNSLKHGLTARRCPILPGEDENAFCQFRDALVADLKPRGVMQREIVDDIVQIRWKLRRLANVEAVMMERQQKEAIQRHERWEDRESEDSEPEDHPVQILAREFFSHGADNPYERMELYRQRLTRAMHTSLRELRKLREETGDADETEVEKTNPNSNHLAQTSELENVSRATGHQHVAEGAQHGLVARDTKNAHGRDAHTTFATPPSVQNDPDLPQNPSVVQSQWRPDSPVKKDGPTCPNP